MNKMLDWQININISVMLVKSVLQQVSCKQVLFTDLFQVVFGKSWLILQSFSWKQPIPSSNELVSCSPLTTGGPGRA